jgi:hypothetical protein
MQKVFNWLCLVCFCVVLIAVPIGIFELLYLNEPKATFIGCRVGDYAIYCDDRPLKYVKEIILNLPLGLLLAPPMVVRSSAILNPPNSWLIDPTLIYLYSLNLVLILTIIHIFRTIVRLATGRRKNR